MGYSIRTAAWRYTEWVAWNGTTLTPIWAAITARELYDHQHEASYPSDFDDLEVRLWVGTRPRSRDRMRLCKPLCLGE